MGLAYPLLCDSGLNLFTEKKKNCVELFNCMEFQKVNEITNENL